MNSSRPDSKLPMWVFFATDVLLLGTAWLIADRSGTPLSTQAMFGIVVCVIAGAIVGLVPLIIRYERQKNEALDDRQRELEALGRTVNGAAEQIGIAANGLHEIAELAQKNLRLAQDLPHKLQDKIAEFQAQLAVAGDAEKEELEKELAALRSSETERLETISDKIAKSTAELAKLEATAHQHLAAANDALGKLSLGTAAAIGKAQAAAEQALAQARVDAAKHLGERAAEASRAVEASQVAALQELDRKLAAVTVAVGAQITEKVNASLQTALANLAAQIERLEATTRAAAVAPAPATSSTAPVSPAPARHPEPAAETPAHVTPSEPVAASSPPPDAGSLPESTPNNTDPAATAPAAAPVPAKRQRKPRRDEAAAASTPSAPAEPAPIPAENIPEVAAVAPSTAEPFSAHVEAVAASPATPEHANGSAPDSLETPADAVPEPAIEASEPVAPPPGRKRAARRVEAEPEPSLGLDLDDTGPRSGVHENGLSSDGATRLIVTAYIGIGNRLFIRGEGPGLSWEKGVPLQFVSIGKWRWETNDAATPIRFKLLKNDDQECAALGAQSLDPGHQQEVTAAF